MIPLCVVRRTSSSVGRHVGMNAYEEAKYLKNGNLGKLLEYSWRRITLILEHVTRDHRTWH